MKKLFFLMCFAVIAANTIYAQSENEEDYEDVQIGDFIWNLEPRSGTAIITYYSLDSAVTTRVEVTIPETVEYKGITYRVTEVFYLNREVFSVNVPSTVKKIASDAFEGVLNVNYKGKYKKDAPWGAYCRNKFIDGNLIYEDAAKTRLVGCLPGNHKVIRIPDKVTSIKIVGEYDYSLDSLILGAGVKRIKKDALGFEYVNKLIVPDGVKHIESGAFSGIYGTITLGSTVRSISSRWISEGVYDIVSYAKTVPHVKKEARKSKKKRDYDGPFEETQLFVPERLANDYNNNWYWHQIRIHCMEEPFNPSTFELTPAREGLRHVTLIDTLDSDAQQHFQLVLDSARQGDSWSQLHLGREYLRGRIVPIDTALAFEWISKAAAQNNREALFYLSCFYENGIGTARDLKKAYELMNIAATDYEDDQHFYPYSEDAVNNLGLWYLDGDKEAGVRRNSKKAVQCFRKAALDKPAAMYNLGCCYLKGWGVKKDYYKAMQCFREAANKGFIPAMADLGYMYYWGMGTLNDLEKAIYWMEKAYDNGCTDVERVLNKARDKIENDWRDNRDRQTKIIGNMIIIK